MKGDIFNNGIGAPSLKSNNWWNAVISINDYGALQNARSKYGVLIAPEVTDFQTFTSYVSKNGPIVYTEPVVEIQPIVETQQIVNEVNSGVETPVVETPMATNDNNQTITIISSDIAGNEIAQVLPVGGGGGGMSFDDSPVVKSEGGYIQAAKGLQVTGWVYPYPFLALTAGGGALGYFIGKKFHQKTIAILALIAAGLMAGSAIGMKTFPPVRKV